MNVKTDSSTTVVSQHDKYYIRQVEADLRVNCYGKVQAPLHIGAEESYSDIVQTLVVHCSANVNLVDSKGDTPLHRAVCRPIDVRAGSVDEDAKVEAVCALLKCNADVSTSTNTTSTYL